jgi:hypothetical protein
MWLHVHLHARALASFPEVGPFQLPKKKNMCILWNTHETPTLLQYVQLVDDLVKNPIRFSPHQSWNCVMSSGEGVN